MRYFYDTEFIEDGKTIDLISIGIIAEDGRMYYAQNMCCSFSKASDWVKENVFPSLLNFDLVNIEPILARPHETKPDALQWNTEWNFPQEIAKCLVAFCNPERHGKPELWGYYSAYDHVALCQLFGTMMKLPEGWPMYTRDLKQWCDQLGNPKLPEQGKGEHHALADAKWNMDVWQFLENIRIGRTYGGVSHGG